MFTDNTGGFLSGLDGKISTALVAMATAAVQLIQDQMLTGYGNPIYDTGNLLNSITHGDPHDNMIEVGTGVQYAPFVHDGTYKMIARPFITDAMQSAYDALADIAAEYLK